ncbi:MFS transporter [Coxiella burnetii]|uniref:MFS transporter n=1 Tax=Coxiella burnetii TaxID=777 RepID=UPI0028FC19BD|nr:MFS transporter [Coxiella burnetii]
MKKNLIVILTSVFVTVGQFAMALYLPALPALTTYFHTFPGVIQLSLTLFLIAFGFSQLFYGSLSDCYGRKPLLLIGLVIVMIGFLIAVFARHLSLLLIARVVQGLGAGSVSVLARAVIRDRFEGKKLVQALSLLIMAASLAPMIAPFIGGHIQHRLGWHSIFIFLFFHSGLILLGIFFLLPETKKTESVPFKMGALLNNYKLLLRHPYLYQIRCVYYYGLRLSNSLFVNFSFYFSKRIKAECCSIRYYYYAAGHRVFCGKLSFYTIDKVF